MAIYAVHNDQPKFIFIINFKVMYSSLNEMLPEYFPNIKFYYKNRAREFNFSEFTEYAIVRNPYSRTVSTFYDKCQRTPEKEINAEKTQLQYCQWQMLQVLQEVRGVRFEIATPAIMYTFQENPQERSILNKNFDLLRTMDFEEYVECLDILLSKDNVDGHFRQQYLAFEVIDQNPWNSPRKIFNSTTIIKLENINQEWDKICDLLGVEMKLKKVNQTDDARPRIEQLYSKENKATVAKLYKTDFKRFKYSTDI